MGQDESKQKQHKKWRFLSNSSKPQTITRKLEKYFAKHPEYVQTAKTLEKFINDIAGEVPKEVVNTILLHVFNKAKLVKCENGDPISAKGRALRAIYFVVEGQVDVESADEVSEGEVVVTVVIDCIHPPAIFGDFGVLWDHTLENDMVTRGKSTVLLQLSSKFVHEICPLTPEELPTLDQWMVARTNLTELHGVDKIAVHNQICTNVLKDVSLFHQWDDQVIRRLVDEIQPNPITFYPIGTYLTTTGEPYSNIVIIIKGYVDVFPSVTDKDPVSSFTVKEQPFTIGEEGLFLKGSSRVLTLLITSPCYVIELTSTQIEGCLQEANGNEKYLWMTREDRWRNSVTTRNTAAYRDNAVHLQTEVLYAKFKQLSEFDEFTDQQVYNMARHSTARVHDVDEELSTVLSMSPRVMLLVVRGGLKLLNRTSSSTVTLISYQPGSIVCRQDWMPPAARLVSEKADTLIVTVPKNVKTIPREELLNFV